MATATAPAASASFAISPAALCPAASASGQMITSRPARGDQSALRTAFGAAGPGDHDVVREAFGCGVGGLLALDDEHGRVRAGGEPVEAVERARLGQGAPAPGRARRRAAGTSSAGRICLPAEVSKRAT